METALYIIRLVCTFAWLVPMVLSMRGMGRLLMGRGDHHDTLFGLVFFTGALMVGFNLRWLLVPGEHAVWFGLYVLCAALAIYAVQVVRAYGSIRDG